VGANLSLNPTKSSVSKENSFYGKYFSEFDVYFFPSYFISTAAAVEFPSLGRIQRNIRFLCGQGEKVLPRMLNFWWRSLGTTKQIKYSK
jgi:hypothetical protein